MNGRPPSLGDRPVRFLVDEIGFEPTTPCVQGRCAPVAPLARDSPMGLANGEYSTCGAVRHRRRKRRRVRIVRILAAVSSNQGDCRTARVAPPKGYPRELLAWRTLPPPGRTPAGHRGLCPVSRHGLRGPAPASRSNRKNTRTEPIECLRRTTHTRIPGGILHRPPWCETTHLQLRWIHLDPGRGQSGSYQVSTRTGASLFARTTARHRARSASAPRTPHPRGGSARRRRSR